MITQYYLVDTKTYEIVTRVPCLEDARFLMERYYEHGRIVTIWSRLENDAEAA